MNELNSGNAPIDELIASYLKDVAAGRNPDRAALMATHADLADELQSFFSDHDRMNRYVEPPTIGPEGTAPGPHTTVRYFGDYELIEELARGGMGVVYKARQLSLNRFVAIKMILAGQLASETDVQRFRAEAEAAANLDHPHIVPIYEVGEHQGQQYFSMKLIDGGSLASRLKALNPKNLAAKSQSSVANQSATMVSTLVAVSRAVHFAHQRGILHRDLKPGNVLLDAEGQPLVTDFGLAKRVGGDSKQTQTGAILGTPSYMAPEQARAEKTLTTAVDVYSLGAILFECLTGQPPFNAATTIETVLQVLEKEPQRPSAINPSVDRDLETITLKCLEKDPAQRYESAAALADELERWKRGEPILAKPISTPARVWKWAKRRPAIATLSATVAALLVSFVVFLWTSLAYQRSLTQHLSDANKDASDQRDEALRQKTRAEDEQKRVSQYWYAADMALAQQAWQSHQIPRVSELLERHRPAPGSGDARGFEWHLLSRLCNSAKATRRIAEKVHLIQLVADGDYAITHAPDAVRIVNLKNDATYSVGMDMPIGCYPRPDAPGRWDLQTARYAPSLKEAKSVTIRRRDLETGEELSASEAPFGEVGTRAYVAAPDGATIAIVDSLLMQNINKYMFDPSKKKRPSIPNPLAPTYEGLITFRDATGKEQAIRTNGFVPSTPALNRIATFSGDGNRFAMSGIEGPATVGVAMATQVMHPGTASVKSSICIIDRTTGEAVRSKAQTGFIFGIAFSPDGSLVAAGGDGYVQLLDATTGNLRGTLSGIRSVTHAMAFSSEGSRLLTGGTDQVVRLWDVRSGELLASFPGHTAGITGVAFAPDNQSLISAETGGIVKYWDANRPPGPIRLVLPKRENAGPDFGQSRQIKRLEFNPDSSTLVALANNQSGIVAFRLSDGAVVRDPEFPQGQVVASCRGPDTWHVVSRIKDDKSALSVWDSKSQTQRIVLCDTSQVAYWTELSPNGRYLVGRAGSHLQIFDLNTGKPSAAVADALATCSFSSDSRHVVTTHEKVVSVYDATTGQLRLSIPQNTARSSGICFSADSKLLLVATSDQALAVYDAERWTQIRTIPIGEPFNHVAVFPDQRRIAIGLAPQTGIGSIKILDFNSGLELQSLPGINGFVGELVISPDGHKLAATITATILGKPEIYVWDATPMP